VLQGVPADDRRGVPALLLECGRQRLQPLILDECEHRPATDGVGQCSLSNTSSATRVARPLLSPGVPQQDVDGVAVARTGLVAAQPVEVVGIALDDLAQRPALVSPEVEAMACSIGAQRSPGRTMRGILARNRRGSPPPVRLPNLLLDRVADEGGTGRSPGEAQSHRPHWTAGSAVRGVLRRGRRGSAAGRTFTAQVLIDGGNIQVRP